LHFCTSNASKVSTWQLRADAEQLELRLTAPPPPLSVYLRTYAPHAALKWQEHTALQY
jgi:hypothetical protein